jgi:hypothetical protein
MTDIFPPSPGPATSKLSDPGFGYDMVVATTQESINSGLREWLFGAKTTVRNVCYVAVNPEIGNARTFMNLDSLMTLTNNVNPFEIPAGTPWDDPRVVALSKVNFVGGYQFRMGVPPGVNVKSLTMVELESDKTDIIFSMYCKELCVVQNTLQIPAGQQPGWDVWTQPVGTAWPQRLSVKLVTKDLDTSLNVPYFDNSGRDDKQNLLDRLNNPNVLGSMFSLQQLLLDIGNGTVFESPMFLPGATLAAQLLRDSFADLYNECVEDHGSPILNIKVAGYEPNMADYPVTAVEWSVTPAALDWDEYKPARTLDYLCSLQNHHLPPITPFSWHWVDDVSDASGVIAINRNIFARYILLQLLPQAQKNCIKADFSCTAYWDGSANWHNTLTDNQVPTTKIVTASGPDVISIRWTPDYPEQHDTDQLTTAHIQVLPAYTCDVNFDFDVITVVQHISFRLWLKIDLIGKTVVVVDKSLTDRYTLSVDEYGQLQTTLFDSTPDDRSESPDGLNWFLNFFSGNINAVMAQMRGRLRKRQQVQILEYETDRRFRQHQPLQIYRTPHTRAEQAPKLDVSGCKDIHVQGLLLQQKSGSTREDHIREACIHNARKNFGLARGKERRS